MNSSSSDRYTIRNGFLTYTAVADDTPRVVVPNYDNLRLSIMFEYPDAPTGGHRGREKTYLTVSRDSYWFRGYQLVSKYIRFCEVCQQVKPITSSCAPLQTLSVPAGCWQSVSIIFSFGFPKYFHKNTGILKFVDRFTKMVHLATIPESITAQCCARIFIDTLFQLCGLPREFVLTVTLGSPRTFGNPCSDLSERDKRCQHLTIPNKWSDGTCNPCLRRYICGYVHAFSS